MKTNLVAATGLAAITAMSAAHAEDFDNRWHADVMASFAYADSDRDRVNNPDSGQPEPSLAAGEGLGWHVALGRSISEKWDLDITLDRGELVTNQGGNTEIDQYGLGIQGSYFFNRGKVAPYLVTGFGMFRTNIDSDADGSEESLDGLKYDLGVGVQAKFGKSGASIKADARYRVDFYQDTSSDYAEYGDLVVNLGLQLPFGEKAEHRASCDHSKAGHSHPADSRWYWTPSVGYVFADSDRTNENDGSAYALSVGRQISSNYNLEFRVSGMEIDLEPAGTDTEIDKNSLTVELQRYFSRSEAFAPYVGVGVGAIRTQVAGVNTSYPAAEAALGFATQVTDNGTAVKAEARYQFDAFDDAGTAGVTEFGDWIVGVGIQVPFGAKPDAKAPVAYDGPITATVIDSDGDGIADGGDACPGTNAGERVDAVGCALVAVAAPIDVPADNKPETVVVFFDVASAVLSDEAKTTLDGIVNTMVQRRYIVAVATGFTDATGEPSYNVDLSRKRANAVKAYLIESGVRNANVIAKGKGENPSNNDTAEGRKMNRRVEVRLLDQ